MKISTNFVLEKETPGALRFQEVDSKGNKKSIADGAAIGSLYIRKTALNGDKTPKKLSVTINAE